MEQLQSCLKMDSVFCKLKITLSSLEQRVSYICQNESQEIVSLPGVMVPGPWIVCCQTDAPDLFERAGFNQGGALGGKQQSLQLGMLG